MAESTVTRKKKKRRRSRRRSPLRWILPLLLLLALAVGGLMYANRSYMLVGGSFISRDAARTDLRSHRLSVGEYENIAQQYPDRTYRWNVPLSGGGADSASEAIAVSAITDRDMELLAYFPALRTIDAREAALTPEQVDALRAAYPQVEVRWSVPIGGARYDSQTEALALTANFDREEIPLFGRFPVLRSVNGAACSCYGELIALQNAFPGVAVTWLVTVDGTSYPQDTRELTLQGGGLTTELLRQAIAALPYLESIHVVENKFTVEEQMALQQEYPGVTFAWELVLLGERFATEAESVDLSGRQDLHEAQLEELLSAAPMLTGWRRLDLTGTSFTQEQRRAVADAMPDTQVLWDFDWFGIPVTTGDSFVDLSNIQMTDTAGVEEMLPYMYALEKVDMCDCGISSEDMDVLNKAHENVRFVWMIHMSHYNFRTDIIGFRGTTEHYGVIDNYNCWNFTYCEDLICLDIGHRVPADLTFLTKMPQIKYLMINGALQTTDLTPVGTLKNLVWLEMFMCYNVHDISPLVGCTSLSDLNIIVSGLYDTEKNFNTIRQMPWLDRLWYSGAEFTPEQIRTLKEEMPDTVFWEGFGKNDSTAGFWRADLDYYEMRDILFPAESRWYMGPAGGSIDFRVIDGVRYDWVDDEWVALGKDPNEGVDWYGHIG